MDALLPTTAPAIEKMRARLPLGLHRRFASFGASVGLPADRMPNRNTFQGPAAQAAAEAFQRAALREVVLRGAADALADRQIVLVVACRHGALGIRRFSFSCWNMLSVRVSPLLTCSGAVACVADRC